MRSRRGRCERASRLASAGRLWACFGAIVLGCLAKAPAPAPSPKAWVELEVYRGLATTATGSESVAPERVDVLVDVTLSMRRRTDSGPSKAAAARAAAAEVLAALPQRTEVTLRALGSQGEGECVGAERLAGPVLPTSSDPLVALLRGLRPRTEGSLADALAVVRGDLDRDEAARRTRVVVFSDLQQSCGEDLCQAAEALVASGAWLEIVPIGAESVPACLETLRPAADQPGPAVLRLSPPEPAFRIESAGRDGAGATLLASGRVGEPAVAIEPGLIRVVVDLNPPETIGPFRVRPGSRALVKLLDFPRAVPRARVWRVEREGEALRESFPPGELPTLAQERDE